MPIKDESIPDTLCFRIYPTFIEATKQQLKTVNRHSFYRISIHQDETLLGDMLEGASPAILADKIFLTKALINFTHPAAGKELIVQLSEHYEGDRLLGEGTFDIQPIKERYLEQCQRFFSLQNVLLNSPHGSMKLVFSIFVERDRYQLDHYIKKFKENERNVLRAKRNINNYKKEIMNRSQEAQASKTKWRPQRELSDIKETPQGSEIKIFFTRRERPGEHDDNISFGSAPPGNYLEIDSAAKFHTKKYEKTISKLKRTLNEAEEREFQAYSNIIDEYRGNSNLVSAFDVGTASLISDGSEQSEMRLLSECETYSEKAVKKFKGDVSRCFNLVMIGLAILLIYLVLAPTKRFTKPDKKLKGPRRASSKEF